jgi:hypothetical protein
LECEGLRQELGRRDDVSTAGERLPQQVSPIKAERDATVRQSKQLAAQSTELVSTLNGAMTDAERWRRQFHAVLAEGEDAVERSEKPDSLVEGLMQCVNATSNQVGGHDD